MQLEVGSIVEGKVTGITKFGAFVELAGGKTGMVHISEVAPTYVKEIRDYLTENQVIQVKILNITEEGKINLSIKKAQPAPAGGGRSPSAPPPRRSGPGSDRWTPGGHRGAANSENMSFEEMMSKFKQTSDDKMSDLKRFMDVKRGSSKRGGSR